MLSDHELTLRPISQKDTDFVLGMRNDLEIAQNFFSDPPIYDFSHQAWLMKNDNANIDLIIEFSNQLVGRIVISNIDYKHQKAEYGIMILQNSRKKGIAYEASVMLLRYIFQNLPIQKIYLHVFADNEKALELYKSLKFSQEGLFRKEYFKNGQWKDVIKMATFREDWIQ